LRGLGVARKLLYCLLRPRLELAGFDHGAPALNPLDRAGDELVAARQEVVENLLALGVADPLQQHLLGGLLADAARVDRLDRK
jgi:hypothetical protein